MYWASIGASKMSWPKSSILSWSSYPALNRIFNNTVKKIGVESMCIADGEKHCSFFFPVFRLHAAEQQSSVCVGVWGVFLSGWVCRALPPCFFEQWLFTSAENVLHLALLRLHWCTSTRPLWACLSKHEKAGEEKREKHFFPLFYFFCRYSVRGWQCRSALVRNLCCFVLLSKVGIWFFCDWKHFTSVLMWAIGGGSLFGSCFLLRGLIK